MVRDTGTAGLKPTEMFVSVSVRLSRCPEAVGSRAGGYAAWCSLLAHDGGVNVPGGGGGAASALGWLAGAGAYPAA
jgi:hypothetical protein